MSIDNIIATRLYQLRKANGLSIDALAQHSGVSKAMISKIERQESSPTAVTLGKLAAGLGVPLAQLLLLEEQPPQRLRKRERQEIWQDPEQGYWRRQVCEPDPKTGLEMVEITLPAQVRVHYPRWSSRPYQQRLWLLEGSLNLAYGAETFLVEPGDCLTFGVDQPVTFTNPSQQPCRYLLVIGRQ